jgi:ABC-type transport system substrate-binding protein
MAFRIEEQILVLDKNQSVRAQTPLPPAVSGHDPAFVSPTLEFNPAKAKALLDMFGYIDRDGDGYRENPDGSPLSFDHASAPTLRERQRNELWKKSMDAIGIRVTFRTVEKTAQLRKQALLGRIQSMSYGYIADIPDGENILQLLYKGSIGQVNYAMFDHPEYNALYEKIRRMPDSPERNALIERMVKLVLVYVPWVLEAFGAQQVLVAPWVIGYRKHPFGLEPWKYLDVDLERRPP